MKRRRWDGGAAPDGNTDKGEGENRRTVHNGAGGQVRSTHRPRIVSRGKKFAYGDRRNAKSGDGAELTDRRGRVLEHAVGRKYGRHKSRRRRWGEKRKGYRHHAQRHHHRSRRDVPAAMQEQDHRAIVVVIRVCMHPMVQTRRGRQRHHCQQVGKQEDRRQTVTKVKLAVAAAHGRKKRNEGEGAGPGLEPARFRQKKVKCKLFA